MKALRTALGSASVWVLVAMNLVPLAGVAFWNWNVEDLVYLYWLETLVVAGFNLLRIVTGDSDSMSHATDRGIELSLGEVVLGKAVLIGAFVAFFGIFTYGQGEMIVTFFPLDGRDPPEGVGIGNVVRGVRYFLQHPGTGAALLAIAAAHAYAFVRYLGDGEYQRAQIAPLMVAPFKRIVVTQVVVIVGGFILAALNSPLAAVVVFIAAKVGADVYFQRSVIP